jgi:GDP-4-dehydro-6-deoxy-D-mannose reductase
VRALLTGAGGFCGRHMTSYLVSRGIEVRTIGRGPSTATHRSVHIEDRAGLVDALTEFKPDYLLHLAGIAHSVHIADYYAINILYAARLLQAMEDANCGGVPTLLVGTAAEYGVVSEHTLPISEAGPAMPRTHYGISKLAQTLLGQALARSGRPIVVARPFNIIGPGMSEHFSIQTFASQLAGSMSRASPVVVEVGNLETVRDFIDVQTAMTVYWRLVQAPDAYGEIVNVCSGRPVRMSDVLQKLISLSGCSVEVRRAAHRLKSFDASVVYGCTAKLHRIVGEVKWRALEDVLAELLYASERNHDSA